MKEELYRIRSKIYVIYKYVIYRKLIAATNEKSRIQDIRIQLGKLGISIVGGNNCGILNLEEIFCVYRWIFQEAYEDKHTSIQVKRQV